VLIDQDQLLLVHLLEELLEGIDKLGETHVFLIFEVIITIN